MNYASCDKKLLCNCLFPFSLSTLLDPRYESRILFICGIFVSSIPSTPETDAVSAVPESVSKYSLFSVI